jgi:lysophospholipase L1-like esterase
MSTFVVLGDSAATGVGDAVDEGIYKGWGHYLFTAMRNMKEYHNVSRPGARVQEMATIQLDIALELRPKVAIFICGGNDVLRNNFNPVEMYKGLAYATEKLQEIGCDVYGMNLHDPSKVIPLPRILKKVLTRRVLAVNRIYEVLESKHNLKLLNITPIPEVYDKHIWHVDRMHPNRIGHQKLATYFAEILRENRHKVQPIYIESLDRTSKIENWKWMLQKGTPWFLKRSVDLFPVITFLVFCELLGLTKKIAPEFDVDTLINKDSRQIA